MARSALAPPEHPDCNLDRQVEQIIDQQLDHHRQRLRSFFYGVFTGVTLSAFVALAAAAITLLI